MAEIPIQPKRTPEIPVEPRRRSVWPWVVGLLALLLLPFLFMRNGRDDTAAVPDTAALADTTTRFDGRTIGAAGGAVAPSTATPGTGAVRADPRDTVARADTTARGDTTTRTDTTGQR